MRIDLRIASDPATLDRAQKANAKAAESNQTSSVSADLSSAVHLQNFETVVAQAPEIRQERVDQLRQAISSGTYSVSDEQLADAMLRNILQR